MINLLPPTLKQQIRFAQRNRVALRYLRLVIVVAVALAGTFGASLYFLNQQAGNLAANVAKQQTEISALAPEMKEAQAAAERLNAIKYIQTSQTRFSVLLSDIAKVLPRGVALDSITLTGDDQKPVQITVTGPTYDSMLATRESLVKSPRVGGADLENISPNTNGFQAAVVFSFKPGQAK